MGRTHQKWLTPLRREQLAPWVLAVTSAFAVALFERRGWIAMPRTDASAFFSAVLSLGGVFTGFMATLNTLLYGMSDQTYGRLKDSGYFQDLRRYLAEALGGSFAMCLVAIAAFYSPNAMWARVALIGVTTFSIASIYRVTRIGTSLLSIQRK
ncbi:MAG: hypothetical protein WC617_11375 [Rhodanobacter sp.]|jgi:hypothetical protein